MNKERDKKGRRKIRTERDDKRHNVGNKADNKMGKEIRDVDAKEERKRRERPKRQRQKRISCGAHSGPSGEVRG